jgi:hypothetical protein
VSAILESKGTGSAKMNVWSLVIINEPLEQGKPNYSTSHITTSYLFIKKYNRTYLGGAVFYEVFLEHCLPFSHISFDHCIVCSSSIYSFLHIPFNSILQMHVL